MGPLAFRRLLGAARALAFAASLPLLTAAPAGAAAGDLLELVDDRGEPLGAAVEVCFVQGLGTDCVDRAPGAGPEALPDFDLLRVEGPEHGPVSVRRRDLPAAEDGVRRLAVPRKARLRVRGAAGHRLTAALHSMDDLDPVRPAYSLAVPANADLRVPAGNWLLALEGRGAAPDLHHIPALPASGFEIRYRPRRGWSLVVRATAKEDEAPVAGARVAVRAARPVGYLPPEGQEAEPEAPPRTAETIRAGLAFLSGIEDPVVDVEVRHPGFVGTTLPGISSTPGTLEVRDAALGKGATLEAPIRVDGEPAAGWRCALLDRSRPSGSETSRELRAMEAGSEGVCRGERLQQGFYWLRVTSPDEGATAEREVQLYDGEAAAVAFDLSPIRVEGEAFRGREPVPGYAVHIYRLSETGSSQLVEPVAEAVTDEDGAYEATVWDAGPHSFHLVGPDGRPADAEHADVQPPSVRVDFHLAPGEVEGIVVDEEGEPVAEAGLMVRWEMAGGGTSMGSRRTGEDGTFRFPLEAGGGILELTASHDGFRPETLRVPVPEDTVPPPVVLTLRRGGLLEGRLVTAAGAPAAGATVQSFRVGADGGLERRASTRTGADGGFELLPAEPPPTRLFATGPGCPLTAADVTDTSEPVLLTCPDAPGTLLLRFVDGEGRPVAGELVLLRHGDLVIPLSVVLSHLSLLGQSTTSDGSGRLIVPGLPPGGYDVYLLRFTSEPLAAQGRPEGHAGSVTVLPGQTAELEVLVQPEP
jgi:hypothetical protein